MPITKESPVTAIQLNQKRGPLSRVLAWLVRSAVQRINIAHLVDMAVFRSFGRCRGRPRARDDVVGRWLLARVASTSKQVEGDGAELPRASALREENAVRGRDVQELSQSLLCSSDDGRELCTPATRGNELSSACEGRTAYPTAVVFTWYAKRDTAHSRQAESETNGRLGGGTRYAGSGTKGRQLHSQREIACRTRLHCSTTRAARNCVPHKTALQHNPCSEKLRAAQDCTAAQPVPRSVRAAQDCTAAQPVPRSVRAAQDCTAAQPVHRSLTCDVRCLSTKAINELSLTCARAP
jgi:hypothetical protein